MTVDRSQHLPGVDGSFCEADDGSTMTPGATDLMERRAFLTMAAAAGLSLPAMGSAKGLARPATARALATSALAIPEANPVFGVNRASFEKFGYSPAIRTKDFLFIAGQVGVRPDGTIPDGVAEQAEWALKRIAEILRLAKLRPTDIVDVISYHVDLAGNIATFMPVKAKYTARPYPAWSIIGVETLARPGLKIEIQAIAAAR